MIYSGDIFKNKTFDANLLEKYGFHKQNDIFTFSVTISDGDFKLFIKIYDNKVDTTIVEIASNEEYNLVYVKGASGKFVGKIKAEYENILLDISQKCTSLNIFKSSQAKQIIQYLKDKYSIYPEYLWEKFPNNAIFREKKSSKWFAAILTVEKNKLGLNGNDKIEIIDLKSTTDKINSLVDNTKYFQGYHMNKKYWFTICLDNSIETISIYKHIDEAYGLIAHKKF